MYVGFGTPGADYFFSGVAEVKQVDGRPKLDVNNKIIYSVQSGKFVNTSGTNYIGLDGDGTSGVRLIISPNDQGGEFKADSENSQVDPAPPLLKIKDTIRQVLPIQDCLSESQMTMCTVILLILWNYIIIIQNGTIYSV